MRPDTIVATTGQYQSLRDIEAVPGYHRIVLQSTGRTIHAIHPINTKYLRMLADPELLDLLYALVDRLQNEALPVDSTAIAMEPTLELADQYRRLRFLMNDSMDVDGGNASANGAHIAEEALPSSGGARSRQHARDPRQSLSYVLNTEQYQPVRPRRDVVGSSARNESAPPSNLVCDLAPRIFDSIADGEDASDSSDKSVSAADFDILYDSVHFQLADLERDLRRNSPGSHTFTEILNIVALGTISSARRANEESRRLATAARHAATDAQRLVDDARQVVMIARRPAAGAGLLRKNAAGPTNEGIAAASLSQTRERNTVHMPARFVDSRVRPTFEDDEEAESDAEDLAALFCDSSGTPVGRAPFPELSFPTSELRRLRPNDSDYPSARGPRLSDGFHSDRPGGHGLPSSRPLRAAFTRQTPAPNARDTPPQVRGRTQPIDMSERRRPSGTLGTFNALPVRGNNISSFAWHPTHPETSPYTRRY
ncbi:hypothetical protein BU26DRAFT_507661 [Trematosphaeria pertusa]|uniref:Uncharacterized protein n=1 Tax=Trematosphaeria pertusa TaxID=390896 RepID=A0A6A6I6L7_9PLEO|nr:uncharacterized protein BU26DRAFT_507661 [Trematosphaeria pertusa]KAF2246001.1 hypothetical protein BU26DRAFT_507661 [Trematosphaeria pertusa]